MIAERNTELRVTTTLQGDKVAMGIDQAAMAHIMNILTDLYSDPELAVIREYSTNALDSHIEAGVTRPIEVTTPSPLSPFFRVKDYGVGLSVDDIHAIYSQYGASTKRATNDQVGMLGLGCKSALTYTDQFTLTAVKNHVRVQVAISRDAEGSGTMTIVDTSPTADPTGVEIVVPAKAHNDFERKARRFFEFWPQGTVKLNGQEPEKLDGLRLSDELMVVEGQQHYIVMGHVAYPSTPLAILPPGFAVVARVPIGAVHFTPSREALHYTPKTNATIEALQTDVRDKLPAALQARIDKCATRVEAALTYVKWLPALAGARPGQHVWTWRNETIPLEFRPLAGGSWISVPKQSYVLSRSSALTALTIDTARNVVWFEGYDTAKSFSAPKKRKINAYVQDKGIEAALYILCAQAPDSPWLDRARVHQWDDVAKIKITTVSTRRGTSRPQGSYDAFVNGTFQHVQAADLPTANLFWHRGNRWEASRYDDALEAITPTRVCVCLPLNRKAKFLRDFPSAQAAYEALQKHQNAWLAQRTDLERRALALRQWGLVRAYEGIDSARVDDPDLKLAAQAARLNVSALKKQWDAIYSINGTRLKREEALHRYPLVDGHEAHLHGDHFYLYVNAVYAARQAGTLA